MFFYVSKTLWFFLQPSSAIMTALVLGLLLSGTERFQRFGRRLAWCGVALLVACGLGPVANVVLVPLEQRFPPRYGKLPDQPVAGIIVLGGYEDGRISEARGTLTLNEAGERFTETALLARRLPDTRVVVSGGSHRLLLEDKSAASAITAQLVAYGIARERIVLEDMSSTTYENAVFSRQILQPTAGQRWILVTSAGHMPRSVAAFRHQGFDVIPWPADFRTKDTGDTLRPFGSVPAGLKRLDEATTEWAGLIGYRLLGRSAELFPGPR